MEKIERISFIIYGPAHVVPFSVQNNMHFEGEKSIKVEANHTKTDADHKNGFNIDKNRLFFVVVNYGSMLSVKPLLASLKILPGRKTIAFRAIKFEMIVNDLLIIY